MQGLDPLGMADSGAEALRQIIGDMQAANRQERFYTTEYSYTDTLGAGLMLTYAYINTSYGPEVLPNERKTPEGITHFLRPGLDLKAELTIPITRSFLISGGWSSAFYPPQKVGEGIGSFGGTEGAIWHVGRAFAMIHIRFPYTVNL